MNKILLGIAKIVDLALGEGMADHVTEEGVPLVQTVVPTVIPDGITPPDSLISGYSWAPMAKPRST